MYSISRKMLIETSASVDWMHERLSDSFQSNHRRFVLIAGRLMQVGRSHQLISTNLPSIIHRFHRHCHFVALNAAPIAHRRWKAANATLLIDLLNSAINQVRFRCTRRQIYANRLRAIMSRRGEWMRYMRNARHEWGNTWPEIGINRWNGRQCIIDS